MTAANKASSGTPINNDKLQSYLVRMLAKQREDGSAGTTRPYTVALHILESRYTAEPK